MVRTDLKDFVPRHEFFVGIDSDGTVFNSMEIKHTHVFSPIAVEIWNLQPIQEEFYAAAQAINLYSSDRGINRFAGLLKTFDCLTAKYKDIKIIEKLPEYSSLRDFVESGGPASNQSLEDFLLNREDAFLRQVLVWSRKADDLFARLTKGLKPFSLVKQSLKLMRRQADLMVVSSASLPALIRDWDAAGIMSYIDIIAGQEAGSKSLQLFTTTYNKYVPEHVLMIGDAPGDLAAAKRNGALFYPIIPGKEDHCWEILRQEAYNKFINGEYQGAYQDNLLVEFSRILELRQK